MSLDTPRRMDLHTEPLHNPATRAVRHLVVLADTIERMSRMRARIDDSRGPAKKLDVLRCWNPVVQRAALEVTCEPNTGEWPREALAFWLDSEVLAPADRPEDAVKILVERLEVRM